MLTMFPGSVSVEQAKKKKKSGSLLFSHQYIWHHLWRGEQKAYCQTDRPGQNVTVCSSRAQRYIWAKKGIPWLSWDFLPSAELYQHVHTTAVQTVLEFKMQTYICRCLNTTAIKIHIRIKPALKYHRTNENLLGKKVCTHEIAVEDMKIRDVLVWQIHYLYNKASKSPEVTRFWIMFQIQTHWHSWNFW